MVGVIDIAAEFLKIDPMLVNQYMQEGTIQAIFFLFFFPSVFLIVFVYTLMRNKGFQNREDLNLLVSVSVYAFILMSGYFTWFVFLSKYWLYLLLVLGGWYLLTHHTRGAPGAQQKTSGGSFKTSGGVMGMLKFAKGEKQLREQFYSYIKMIGDLKEKAMKTSGGIGSNDLSRFTELAEKTLTEYEGRYGGPLNHKATEMRQALDKALSS